MEKKETSEVRYEEAVHELERIVRSMESDEPDIDSLSEQLRRAQQLIRLCRDKLTRADGEIRKILAEE